MMNELFDRCCSEVEFVSGLNSAFVPTCYRSRYCAMCAFCTRPPHPPECPILAVISPLRGKR